MSKAKEVLEKKKCQTIYWNLLMLLDDERDEVSSPHYLREFFQTARCETVPGEKMTKDLRDTREQIEKHVTPEVWKDIENYNEDIRGTNRALQTMIHYRTWHHQLLFSALDLKGQAYYPQSREIISKPRFDCSWLWRDKGCK